MSFNVQALVDVFSEVFSACTFDYCPLCLGKLKIYKKSDFTYRCSRRTCRKRGSFTKGTPFYRLKMSLENALTILKMWLLDIKTTAIAELLEIDRVTVSSFLKRCSKVLINNFSATSTKIGGKNIIVEIDESRFGKNKYGKGHLVKGVWVFGMVERTPKRRIVLVPVDLRNAVTLEEILKQYVHEESIIHSDCWKAYANLQNLFALHNTVNHSKFFKDPITNVHTNTIEGNWSAIKQQTPVKYRCKTKVIVYLIKYMLKRNYSGCKLKNLLKFLFL
jgi:hypothetical protein